ncbi:hypothetical protein BGX28_001639 [Mortierella sp. GBA30]|nr:hypothetical protein BGX28_001639 [Mortierella sp. GBA30]
MPDFRKCKGIDESTPTKDRKPSLAMDREAPADLLEKVVEVEIDLGLVDRHWVTEISKEGVGGLIMPSNPIGSKLGNEFLVWLVSEGEGHGLGEVDSRVGGTSVEVQSLSYRLPFRY